MNEVITLKRQYYYLGAIIVALFLLAQDHLKHSFGDTLFRLFGVSPWTNTENSGAHVPAIIGMILLLIGFVGSVRYLRPRYPKIASRLVMGCIAFFLVFPFITEGIMSLVKYNSNQVDSVSISNGKCSYQSEGNHVKANCTLKIFNYGKVENIAVRPILPGYLDYVDIEFEQKLISLHKHSEFTVGVLFEGNQKNGSGMSGMNQDVGFEVTVKNR